MAELNGTAPQGMDGGGADGNAGGDADHGSNSNRGSRGTRPSLTQALAEEATIAHALVMSLGNLTADDEDILLTTIEGETNLHGAIAAAMTRTAELDALIEGIDGFLDRAKARRDRLKNQHTMIREAVAVAMQTAGIRKLELPIATLSISKSRPSAIIDSEWDVPDEYWKPQDPKLDKAAVLDALKSGAIVPGAHLSDPSSHLTVRSK